MRFENKIKARIKANELLIECDRVKIECKGAGHNTKMYVDGKKVRGIHDLNLEISCDSIPKLSLNVWPMAFGVEDNGKT